MDAFSYDLRGLKCPLPVLKTRQQALFHDERRADSASKRPTRWLVIDIPHFCKEDGHALLETEITETGHRFLIRKR